MQKRIKTKGITIRDLELDSLFYNGMTLVGCLANFPKIRYDLGKYSPSNFQKQTLYKQNEPIWYTTQSDSNGSYIALWCFDDSNLTDKQQQVYDSIIEVFERTK
jgi:hypothetical protein